MKPILYNEVQNYLLNKYASSLTESYLQKILLERFLEKHASAKGEILKGLGRKVLGTSILGSALASIPLSLYGTYGSIIGYGYNDPITHDETGDKYLQNLTSLAISDPRVSFTLGALLSVLSRVAAKQYAGPLNGRSLGKAFAEKLFNTIKI